MTLTVREQQLLADLERATSQSDPRLDAWLQTARRSWIPLSATGQLVVAEIALSAGTALMLATFTRWLWVASLAVLLQTGALALGVRAWGQLRQDGGGRDRETGRRRSWMRVSLAAAAGLLATGAAFGFAVVADQSSGQFDAACYAQPRLDAHRLKISVPTGSNPVGACQTAWAFGRVPGQQAVADPALTACVLPSGPVGVFPDPAGTVCGRVGLAAVARPEVNISPPIPNTTLPATPSS